jgi:glycosyltransferase involved in cell wall biosynthesis
MPEVQSGDEMSPNRFDNSPFSLRELHLIQLTPSLGTGGMERLVTHLALSLQSRVDRLLVCSSGGDRFESELEEGGVRFERIPRPRPNPQQLLRAGFALARILRRERPHLIHAHNPVSGATAALARRFAWLPEIAIVTTYHGAKPERLNRAVRVLGRSSDIVVGVSPETTRSLSAAGLPAARCATVFNAVDVRHSRSRDEVRREFYGVDCDLVVSVGRLAEEKNQALLIDSLARLAHRRRRLRALIVGEGVLEQSLRDHIRSSGLDDVVTLTGRRDDALDIVAAADLFVLSSNREGLPLVLLEAMTLGCPIVATKVGGVADVIHHEQTGLLVEPGNPAALADAIEEALSDTSLTRRLTENARDYVREHCSTEVMLDSYAAVYEAALTRRREVRGLLRANRRD